MTAANPAAILSLTTELKKLREQVRVARAVLGNIQLGHQYGCGTNDGLRCTCVAAYAIAALKRIDEIGRGEE